MTSIFSNIWMWIINECLFCALFYSMDFGVFVCLQKIYEIRYSEFNPRWFKQLKKIKVPMLFFLFEEAFTAHITDILLMWGWSVWCVSFSQQNIIAYRSRDDKQKSPSWRSQLYTKAKLWSPSFCAGIRLHRRYAINETLYVCDHHASDSAILYYGKIFITLCPNSCFLAHSRFS